MRTSKFTPERMAMALRQAVSRTAVAEICRKMEITQKMFIAEHFYTHGS